MSYYSVLAVSPTTDEWILEYIAPTNDLVTKHGGKYLARTSNHERLEGQGATPDATIRVTIEWPSKEAALGFMSDPEYAPLLKARTDGSESHRFLIEGQDDLS